MLRLRKRRLVCRGLAETDRPLLLIGEGSNLLLTADYAGTVITPERRFDVAVRTVDTDADGVYLDCWAGTTFDDVVAYAVAHGYHGAENLSLIPGEVGASAVQNIGAYGAEARGYYRRGTGCGDSHGPQGGDDQ